MWGLRKIASFLLSKNHTYVWDYPIFYLWQEYEIAKEIAGTDLALKTTLDRMAVCSVISTQAGKEHVKMVEALNSGY